MRFSPSRRLSLLTPRPWTVRVPLPPERTQRAVSTFWFSSFDNNLTSPVWLASGALWRGKKGVGGRGFLMFFFVSFFFPRFRCMCRLNATMWVLSIHSTNVSLCHFSKGYFSTKQNKKNHLCERISVLDPKLWSFCCLLFLFRFFFPLHPQSPLSAPSQKSLPINIKSWERSRGSGRGWGGTSDFIIVSG